MTTKYESVLSEADKVNLIRDHDDITDLVDRTEQATLAKLQPQLDAIGAGGVSSREKHGFTHCIFHGDAPCGYSSWEQWINTPVKTNVFIRDATIDDWENARNSGRSAPAVSLGGQQFRKQPVCYVEPACTIEVMGGHRVCRDGDGFPVYRYPHIPEGYKLVPVDCSSVKKEPDWYASEDGKNLFCMDFTHDVKLTLDGDFDNDIQRLDYAKNLVVRLNGVPNVGAIDPFKTPDTE